MITGVRMSLRLFATLALLLGLTMWLFTSIGSLSSSVFNVLIFLHITCAILVLLLSIGVLLLPASAEGTNTNIRGLQSVTVVLAICTMLVGYFQYQGTFSGLAATLTHLILALALVGLIEMTLARQSRIARASRMSARQ